MDYAKAVAEGRRLLRRSEADLWAFAELSARVVATGVSQRQWGTDVGASQPYVSLVSRVWARFGRLPATKRPRFADALETVRSRSEAVVDASEERARRYRAQLLSRPLGERVELTGRLLDDPNVARAVGTAGEQDSPVRVTGTAARARPEPVPPGPFEAAAERLSKARHLVERAAEEIRGAKLTKEERAGLLVLVAEIEAAARTLREALDGRTLRAV